VLYSQKVRSKRRGPIVLFFTWLFLFIWEGSMFLIPTSDTPTSCSMQIRWLGERKKIRGIVLKLLAGFAFVLFSSIVAPEYQTDYLPSGILHPRSITSFWSIFHVLMITSKQLVQQRFAVLCTTSNLVCLTIASRHESFFRCSDTFLDTCSGE